MEMKIDTMIEITVVRKKECPQNWENAWLKANFLRGRKIDAKCPVKARKIVYQMSLPDWRPRDDTGMTQGILSKTGMGYGGTKDGLIWAQGSTHGVYWVIYGFTIDFKSNKWLLWSKCLELDKRKRT